MKILCLSNGHGEDAIAIELLQHLQNHATAPELQALPIVGEGVAYSKSNIPIIGPVQKMPSGGFIYMDGAQLWRDLRGGLVDLSLAQYKVVRNWASSGGKILAVGDIVPLLFAYLSGADYAFVGTAKSEYYLRDDRGVWLSQTSRLERSFGSVYLPWERWLMARSRCKAVFPRDRLTADILQQRGVAALFYGNPMMDRIAVEKEPPTLLINNTLHIVLLPGSRMPEALNNWQKIIESIAAIISSFSNINLVFLAAIAPGIEIDLFSEHLLLHDWSKTDLNSIINPIGDRDATVFTRRNATLFLTQNSFRDCLQVASLAIAMTGTATEQFVGSGKPVISIPGDGPQFVYAFAEAQTRLLGSSVILATKIDRVPSILNSLLANPTIVKAIWSNGKRRMAGNCAAFKIANCLAERFCFA